MGGRSQDCCKTTMIVLLSRESRQALANIRSIGKTGFESEHVLQRGSGLRLPALFRIDDSQVIEDVRFRRFQSLGFLQNARSLIQLPARSANPCQGIEELG